MMAHAAQYTLPLERRVPTPALRLEAALLAALLAGLVGLIYLIAASSVVSAGYDGQRLAREREEWRAKNEQLRLEVAKVRSLAWIELEATSRLGMVKPEMVSYVPVQQPGHLALQLEPPTRAQFAVREPPPLPRS